MMRHLCMLMLVCLAGSALPLRAAEPVTLGLLVSGQVAEVRVAEGARVKKGELLLRLDEAPFRARLREARARLRAARVEEKQMAREFERARELYDRTLLSDYELQSAEVAWLKARAALRGAERGLVEARLDLERSRLQAPFAGRVVKVRAYVGQPVRNDFRIQPLVELAPE